MTNEPPKMKNMQIRADDKLPPCPFCGSFVNSVVSIPFDAEKNNRVIACSRCGAQGPSHWPPTSTDALDLAAAQAAWSQRAAPSR